MSTSLSQYTEVGKIASLQEILQNYGSLLVGFSGGVDSSFLLKAALDFLGSKKVLAVTASGVIHPDSELDDARELAHDLGAPWKVIDRSYLAEKEFRNNPYDRCYYCKKGLFERLIRIAETEGLNEVATGSIHDDRTGHRPGRRAGDELGIKRPLERVGLTKDEVRKFGKETGLPVWNKPSNACLATRVPFGDEITEEKLLQIDSAEAFLRKLGFKGFRVRHHGDIARLELTRDDLEEALSLRNKIVDQLQAFGYKYVTLDLEGYRSGSLSEEETESDN